MRQFEPWFQLGSCRVPYPLERPRAPEVKAPVYKSTMTGLEAFEYALKGKTVRRKGFLFPFCFENGRMRVPGGVNLPTQHDWLADDWELMWPDQPTGKSALERLANEDPC